MPTWTIKYAADDPALRTGTGRQKNGIIEARSSGCSLFGPYVDLPVGRFSAIISFSGYTKGLVEVDVCAENGTNIVCSRTFDLDRISNCMISIEFDLSEPAGGCEVRLQSSGDIHADIIQVEITSDRPIGFKPDTIIQNPYPLNTWILADVHSGQRMWLDAGDGGVSRHCILGDYEKSETKFVKDFLKKGMSFIDIGANAGWYTMLAAEAVGSDGIVYSFEPRPNTFNSLERSVSENDFNHVRLFNLALSDKPGLLPISTFREGQNPGGTWLLTTPELQNSQGEGYEKFNCEVACLDDIEIERCNLIKIDIEGAEFLAFKGARKWLERYKPTIISEINPSALNLVSGVSVREYLRFITEIGYEVRELTVAGIGELLADGFADSSPEMVNVVLIPR